MRVRRVVREEDPLTYEISWDGVDRLALVMWPFKSDVSISRNYSEISLRDKGWSRVCCNSDRGRTCSSHNNCKLKAGYAYQKVWKTFGQCALRFLSVRIQFFSRVAGCRYRWQSVGVSVIRCCEKRNTLSIKRSDVGTGQNQTKTRKFVSHVILEPTIRRPENSLNWIRLARSPCGEEIDGAYKNLSVAVPNSFRTSVGKFLALWGGNQVATHGRQGKAEPLVKLITELNLQSLLPQNTITYFIKKVSFTIDLIFSII